MKKRINLEKYAKPVLRIAMALVFLYFGSSQLSNPTDWTGFLPDFALFLGTPENIVFTNGIFEVTFGILLLIGLFTRFVALVLSIHLFVIASTLGINPLGIRDFGLTFAAFVVFLHGPDDYCLDKNLKKKN